MSCSDLNGPLAGFERFSSPTIGWQFTRWIWISSLCTTYTTQCRYCSLIVAFFPFEERPQWCWPLLVTQALLYTAGCGVAEKEKNSLLHKLFAGDLRLIFHIDWGWRDRSSNFNTESRDSTGVCQRDVKYFVFKNEEFKPRFVKHACVLFWFYPMYGRSLCIPRIYSSPSQPPPENIYKVFHEIYTGCSSWVRQADRRRQYSTRGTKKTLCPCMTCIQDWRGCESSNFGK